MPNNRVSNNMSESLVGFTEKQMNPLSETLTPLCQKYTDFLAARKSVRYS